MEHMVSIVIPTWNQRKILAECLSSILSLKNSVKTEIIVVDDASSDNTSEYIDRNFPGVTVIKNDKNQGYAKSVNRAIELSRGDILFLLNDDTRFFQNTVDVLCNFLMNHPDAGAAAPLLIYPDGSFQVSCRRFPTPSALIFEKLHLNSSGPFKRWKLNEKEHLKGGPVPQPMASALLIKRECWEAVGPFDERFPIFFNDVDWCYRVYKNTDYKIYLCPDVKVIHHVGATVNTLGAKKKQEFYKGLIRFYLKHFPFKAEMVKL
jgi:N-acetylglucosaminyl-diphospho-decaprenol L-rhamnosyltransferase